MVWASTRIKRNAARAFEREEIETPEFSLIKPDGFLAMAEPPGGLLFSAYSKEFGTGEAESIRRATAEIAVIPASSLDEAVELAKAGAAQIVEATTGMVDGKRFAYLVAETTVNGIKRTVFTKSFLKEFAAVQLTATCLADHSPELAPKLEEMLASFALK